MKSNHYVIGVGGVGSWLAPSLCLLKSPDEIILVDGDTLEKKNMNRQLFKDTDIGKNKALALSELYKCRAIPEFYTLGAQSHFPTDWLFCCVDNNPARVAVLHSCDTYGCKAIIAANETFSSEAVYYQPDWKGTRLDPRIYYPNLLTDHSNDPAARAIGCTGEAQTANPQLVSANFSAAALAQNLFVLWGMKVSELDHEITPRLPFKFTQNLTKQETHIIKEQL